MALTNEQWTEQLQASEDPDSLYPDAPEYDMPEGAHTDYEVADDDHYDGDEGDEYDDGGEAFGDYADPEEDGDPGAPQGLVEVPLDSGEHDEPQRPRRFDGKIAMGFAAAGLVAVLVAIIGAVVVYGSDEPARPTAASVTEPGAVPPTRSAAPKPAAAESADRPLPYSADAAGSCAAGSTSAQTMAGADPHSAFVCVRGGADGQVIEIDLSKTYMITAISLTPGWVGKDASGVSQWGQYRVVTTVQYLFNDTDKTMVTQETKNVHGEAVQPIKRVLASKIRILIRQTSRPPAQPEPGASPTPTPGGFNLPAPLTLAPLPGSSLGGQAASDPVDAAFAIKSLKIIGHEPL
ncbi:hypothetical protein BTO20_36835 (plasmid) [Mycobacterium dioxanotrophicus]|uniref:F5/8 type C domain-containing protein n=1 Tax=Mycobacterium dioxanotrophicus TaxID=482462 RepID=A0A1Y0CFZ9_9MYCO|nr:hypothetical protein [Mycobacterium dioxanotrophicus]ART74223.1 hypothetical protein BTO20_36835 [Mycobacterium dioxanotrophicus]